MKEWLIPSLAAPVLLAASLAVDVRYFPVLVGGVLLVLIALIAAHLQIRRPGLGVMALVLSAVAFPVHFGPNEELSLPPLIAAGICGSWLAGLILSRRIVSVPFFSPIGLSVALLAAALCSAAIAQFSVFPVPAAPVRAQVGGLLIFALSVGLFVSLAEGVRSVREIKHFTWAFLLAGAFVLLMYRPQLDSLAQLTTYPTTVGSVFWTWLVAISAGQALFNCKLHPIFRFACLLLALAAMADGIALRSSWASGWLPPLIALGVLFLIRFPAFTLGVGLLVAPAVGYSLLPVFDRVMEVESYSLLSRAAAWDTLWSVIEASPVIGLGPANYYHFTHLFPTLGWYVKFSSHQQYIDLVAQTGFVGLTFFLLFAGAVLRTLWRMQGQVSLGFERAFLSGALAASVGCLASGMLADWVLPFVYNIGLKGFRSSMLFWLFLGCAMALHRMHAPRRTLV